ncbi:MAG: DNA primase [Acidovorax sp. SCN 65-28]|uniref:AAA family ATPase n=1 Tax=Acidovorax sp. TaxID=1872122 RepID=UPI00086C634E|nr:AAA family ATPase [Acidovorax sp.]ODS69045.1 MAG: DNA primase [Acidovorax sp. SCN 65-28]
MAADLDRARDALHAIPPDLPRDEWVRAGMAAQAAGLDFDAFNDWSAQAGNYDERAARDTWRSFKPGRGVGAGTLYRVAAEHGWRMGEGKPQQRAAQAPRKAAEPPRKPTPCMSPAEVWERCEPATAAHGYIAAKAAAGVPLDGLRVVPTDDPLRIAGQNMAGALVVPALGPDGLQSLQLIPPPGGGKKLNLPGAPMAGASFTVGEVVPGGVVHVCEGIGQAWACWQATGHPAVVCFGWGNVGKVAADLRQRDASARLVVVPDVGKEESAAEIAQAVGAAVAYMPQGEVQNFDANDLAQRDGFDVLACLLEAAKEPSKPAPRYKLLSAADLRDLPPLAWRVRGVLPAVGLAALYGPSASGKSFLAFDMAAAIAEGQRWFDCRVEAAPVVYAALEGEAGFKLRAQAWETSRGRALPDGLHLMLQPFKLTDGQDVLDLTAVVPAGAVVVVDTLNRAAPTADENSSRDMGEILEAAKTLQSLTRGLVLLVHHTGKNAAAGLRGHSSLFAAMDAAIEVSRDGDRREWKVAKSKDGQDGAAHPFKLQVETLGVEETGEAITSCVVLRDTAAQDVRAVKLPQGGNQRVVLDALRPLFKDGTNGKPGAPPLRPCIELEAAITAAASKLTCPTDKRTSRTREAITGLVARGVLGCNEGWLWQQ